MEKQNTEMLVNTTIAVTELLFFGSVFLMK